MTGLLRPTQTISPKDRLILALDVDNKYDALKLIDELYEQVGVFKVGLELITYTGPSFLEELVAQGLKVFFDCKFMDIPNTVAGASAAVAKLGVSMFNVHALGGSAMMKAAVEAAQTSLQTSLQTSSNGANSSVPKTPPLVLAVTVLTSINQSVLNDELGISKTVKEEVQHLAKLAEQSGIGGVVASAQEAALIREVTSPSFVIVTPGVRPAGAQTNDQQRVLTPYDAISNGSDYLVVGRPITAALNKIEAAKSIVAEIEAACGS